MWRKHSVFPSLLTIINHHRMRKIKLSCLDRLCIRFQVFGSKITSEIMSYSVRGSCCHSSQACQVPSINPQGAWFCPAGPQPDLGRQHVCDQDDQRAISHQSLSSYWHPAFCYPRLERRSNQGNCYATHSWRHQPVR